MRRLRWLLLVLVLAIGGWYAWSPRHAWDRFLGALVSGREAELQATIDFPILRDNLRHDLRTALVRKSGSDSPIASGISGALVNSVVDMTVTPQGIARLVTGFGTRTPRPEDADSIRVGTETAFHYRSPSRVDVRVWPRGDDEQDGGIFTFERSGLSWRLVRIWSDRLADQRDMF
jgi:hypothetical protein